jgi:hypothetical protein
MAVAALDLGLYDEAETGLLAALAAATEIDLPEEMLASLVALTQLAIERGNLHLARQHGTRGIEVVLRRDPERYLPLLQALLARTDAATEPGAARHLAEKAEATLPDVPVPRRTQVQQALAWAYVALNDRDNALRSARTVLQTAGSRGFRLLSLEARALMAHLTEGEEQKMHRSVGQELARDFTTSLAPEMARSFARRPFLKYLDDPSAPIVSAPDPREDDRTEVGARDPAAE